MVRFVTVGGVGLLAVLSGFIASISVARAEPAPRVREVSKEEKIVRDINGDQLTTALFAPMPVYPFHARLHRLEGRGMFEMLLRPDGTVSGVAVLRSTGIAALDRAAAAALIRWRFPTQNKLRIHGIRAPVNFVMMDRFRGGTILDR